MNWPQRLLSDVLWDFRHPPFSSEKEFIEALTIYNEKIREKRFPRDWYAQALSIGSKMLIQYEWWDTEEEDSIEDDLLLSSNDGNDFTIGTLLYKIHNSICDKFPQDDNCFFEGLILFEDNDPNVPDIPYYYILLGS